MATEHRPLLIVGYDGREASDDALALAALLAGALDAELQVVVVLVHAPVEVEAPVYADLLRAETERFEQRIHERLGDREVRILVLPAASAARTLHGLAERDGASLIVLGSTHRGVVGRVLPGSVGERLLSAGPCAVAVAPRGFAGANASLRSIAVAWAEGPESERALGLAAELAMGAGCPLRLLSVVEPVSHAALASPGAVAAWTALESSFKQAEAELASERERDLAAVIEGLPVADASAELLRGIPSEQLVEASAGLDLLILGSRGYGPLRRVLLGSVSSPVLREAQCPVIVVPRDDRD